MSILEPAIDPQSPFTSIGDNNLIAVKSQSTRNSSRVTNGFYRRLVRRQMSAYPGKLILGFIGLQTLNVYRAPAI